MSESSYSIDYIVTPISWLSLIISETWSKENVFMSISCRIREQATVLDMNGRTSQM